jgi:hypothetical protein
MIQGGGSRWRPSALVINLSSCDDTGDLAKKTVHEIFSSTDKGF